MASSRGSTASSKPPKQRLAVTAQSATSKPWFTCSQPNSISCFQTEIVATHAKQRRTNTIDVVLNQPDIDAVLRERTAGVVKHARELRTPSPPALGTSYSPSVSDNKKR